MAEAFLELVLFNLNSMVREEIGLLWGINNEIQKLSSLFTTIKAVIKDAEEKQLNDRAIQNWLQKLNIATHEVDDILDDCATEASRVKHKVNFLMPCFCPSRTIWFRHRTGKRMKEVIQRLNEIADEREKFHLNEFTGMRRVKTDFMELRETSSILTQPEVFGRNEDREKIVDILVNQIKDVRKASVLPILGVGGLGKTTLAQFVFNDERVGKHFELKLWVCVSNDFNVKRITKAIIESAGKAASEAMDLDPLQGKLQDLMKGKRYLLVLDDLWNDDPEKWEKLKCALECGSSGSSILITTRVEKVACTVGTLPTYCLSGLLDVDCWSLFRQRAFGQEAEPEEHPNLVSIGKEIVKKCRGVPLAAKALGGLLRFKREENEWLFVKESELWNLPQGESSILPALRLSYQNLPLEQRQCFAYCAVYPKDKEMEKEEVIQLWMANGFISPNGRLELEDVGDAIWNELYWGSFFQDAKKDKYGNVTTFKMHDLVHDLAESVMEGKFRATEIESPSIMSNSTIRHAELLLYGDKLTVAFPRSTVGGAASSSVLARFSSLRTFKARVTRVVNGHENTRLLRETKLLISGIGKMKHLRYLNLSCSEISMLPESVCQLWNLQTLKLNWCYKLRSLPKNLRLLQNLRHLYLHNCSLTHIPSGIGRLTCLKTLSTFVVGEGRCSRISELRELRLAGKLSIYNLERVDPKDSEKANLMAKDHLREIMLCWGKQRQHSNYNDEQVLETLKPPPNLRYLKIENFKGTNSPNWFGVSTLKNVVEIRLDDCSNCTHLPALGDLPHLQRLRVSDLPTEYLDDQDTNTITRFPSLIDLQLQSMSFLKDLCRSRSIQCQGGRDDQITLFPLLWSLKVFNCPNLTLFPVLPSLRHLEIRECQNTVLNSISNLGSLSHLSVKYDEELTSFPDETLLNLNDLEHLQISSFIKLVALPGLASLTALTSLDMHDCPELKSLLGDRLQGLNSLANLRISGCNKLESLTDGALPCLSSLKRLIIIDCPHLLAHRIGIKYFRSLEDLSLEGFSWEAYPEELRQQNLTTLQSLSIESFPNLASLPSWLGELTSLKHLRIEKCPKLESLPASIQSIASLRSLFIEDCPELARLLEMKGEGSQKIKHIPGMSLGAHKH